MTLFPFGRKKPRSEPESEDILIPVPIPPLIDVLQFLEQQKGAPLGEADVLAARDNAVCMMLPLSAALRLAEARGYDDIDPENVWAEWQGIRLGDR